MQHPYSALDALDALYARIEALDDQIDAVTLGLGGRWTVLAERELEQLHEKRDVVQGQIEAILMSLRAPANHHAPVIA